MNTVSIVLIPMLAAFVTGIILCLVTKASLTTVFGHLKCERDVRRSRKETEVLRAENARLHRLLNARERGIASED